MTKNEKLISLETERACLASLIKNNTQIPDVAAFVKADFFYFNVHSTIFSLITSLYQEKGNVDQIILVSKLKQLGIADVNGLDVFKYIEVIYNSPVNPINTLDYYKELVKFHLLRKSYQSLLDGQKYILDNVSKPLSEIVHSVSVIVTDAATGNIDSEDRIVDLYGELPEELSKRAESKKEPSLWTDFPVFDKWYGGIYLGDMYVFAAPAKRGKSTFLNYLSYKIAKNPKNNVKVLYLDTEMETWRVMCRTASSITHINEWFFKNGKFAEDSDKVKKVHQMFETLQEVKGKVFHLYVGNRSIDEIISICRRWYMKFVQPGEDALIAYDYIKLDGDGTKLSEFYKEYQAVGEKTDKLKKLASSYENLAVITSVQTNAECDIAMSQRIKWYASNVYILQPKNLEEIQEDGVQYGTHKLIDIATRNQGEDAKGMKNNLKLRKADGTEEYRQNFINYDFDSFKVEERGTLEEVLMQRSSELRAKGGKNKEIDF